MALIKCSECGKEISNKAKACLSCGNPINNILISSVHEDKKIIGGVQTVKEVKRRFIIYGLLLFLVGVFIVLPKSEIFGLSSIFLSVILFGSGFRRKSVIIIPIMILFFCGYYLYQKSLAIVGSHCTTGTFLSNLTESIENDFLYSINYPIHPYCFLDKSKEIILQQVNNLGYTFYIGQVDYPNTPVVSDETKNQITKIIDKAGFPRSLLKDIPIIIVNSLAITSGQFISDPNAHRGANVAIFGPDFLNEGGKYATYDNGMAVIYINKIVLDKGLLTDNFTHELGHAIGATLTDQDWKKYYQLRNIPTGTALYGKIWNKSPAEDFAEVYRSVFTGSNVGTAYGLVNQQTKNFINAIIGKIN